MGNMWGVPQRVKNRTVMWSIKPMTGFIQRKCNHYVEEKPIFPAPLLHYIQYERTPANANQPMTGNEKCGNVVYVHTHTHTYTGILSGLKTEKIFSFAATWMSLEDMLNELIQEQRNRYRALSFISGI